jgi:hypothetical protein
MKHTAFFGDGEKTFALTTTMIQELERKTGHGIGLIFWRIQQHHFSLQDIAEVIRLGLIGGGTTPIEADALVKTYVDNRPLIESMEVALDVISARFIGTTITDDLPSDVQHAAATGDLAAAVTEADHG